MKVYTFRLPKLLSNFFRLCVRITKTEDSKKVKK